MNLSLDHSIFFMSKLLVVCRHGKYDPGFEVLNEEGIRQVRMMTGSLSVFFDNQVSVCHSNGPRSTQSAKIACKFLGERAVYLGEISALNPVDMLREKSGDVVYFTSGEQMNEILPQILSRTTFCRKDYRATKGKVYAEAIEILTSDEVLHRHSLEIS